jgi:hypothetical protein
VILALLSRASSRPVLSRFLRLSLLLLECVTSKTSDPTKIPSHNRKRLGASLSIVCRATVVV